MTERLDIGAILSRVFQYYREQAGVLLPAALIVFIPVTLIAGGIRAAGTGILVALAAQAVQLVGNAWYQATVVEAVRDIQDGVRDLSLGQLFSSAFQVVGPVVLAGLVIGIGVAIGFVLLIVPGLFLLTIWAVTIPTVVLERRGVFDALGRSRELVRGNGWQVFGVLVVLIALQLIATLILVAIFIGIGDFVGAVIGSLLATVLLAPLGAIAATVLYLELRRIREGAAPAGTAAPAAPDVPGATAPPPPPATPPPPPPPPPGTPPPPPPA